MWLKSLETLKTIFPEDGKYHDLQIINKDIYIDGVLFKPQKLGAEVSKEAKRSWLRPIRKAVQALKEKK